MTDNLMIYVPTYHRVDRQITLGGLPRDWLDRTIVVCPSNERKAISRNFPHLHSIVTPALDVVPHIAAKRAWIFRHAGRMGYSKIIVFDDDLQFYTRVLAHNEYAGYGKGDRLKWPGILARNREFGRSFRSTPFQMEWMFDKIERMLNTFAHGGISQKYMNQAKGQEWTLNTKVTHALAYQTFAVLDNCKLNRVRMFEDLDYTLQLFAAGFPNAVLNWSSTNDPQGFNAKGGESEGRKMKDIADGADLMAKLHPGLVRVVERQGPDADKFGPKRIVVAWKKAAVAGGAWKNTIGGEAR